MTLQASEDRRWVNEQREEGMEKHKMRMSDARVLGALDAELTSASVDRTEWKRRRRGHYKQNVDSTADDSDDSGDSERKGYLVQCKAMSGSVVSHENTILYFVHF